MNHSANRTPSEIVKSHKRDSKPNCNLCPCGSGNIRNRCCHKKGSKDAFLTDRNPRVAELDQIIKKFKENLTWPLREYESDGDSYFIQTSLSVDPTVIPHGHTIFKPLKLGTDYLQDYRAYIHELMHATLCEQIHILFSSAHYVDRTDLNSFIDPFFRAATNWFVEGKVASLCPGESYYGARKTYEVFFNKYPIKTLERFLEDDMILKAVRSFNFNLIESIVSIILIMAFIIHNGYACIDLNIDMLNGRLRKMIEAFLAVTPGHPSIDNLFELVNRLLFIFYPFQVRVKMGDHLRCNVGKETNDIYGAIKIEAFELPESD